MDQIPADKLAVQIDYWKQGAASDLESAEDIILNTKRYAAGLFFLHLALEKILKALYVHKQSQYAPITHNLVSLVFKCGLTVEKQQEESLVAFNEFNIETRYPDDRIAFEKRATKEFAKTCLDRGKELFQWISQHLNQ